jgi:hypothetical protein
MWFFHCGAHAAQCRTGKRIRVVVEPARFLPCARLVEGHDGVDGGIVCADPRELIFEELRGAGFARPQALHERGSGGESVCRHLSIEHGGLRHHLVERIRLRHCFTVLFDRAGPAAHHSIEQVRLRIIQSSRSGCSLTMRW